MNKTIIFGRMVKDPDVRFSEKTQKQITMFSVAVNRTFKNKETNKYDVDYFNCVVFGKTAEVIGNNFSKGDKILIEGEMRQDKWKDKDGTEKSAWRLYVNGFDFVEYKPKAQATTAPTFDDMGVDVDF